MRSLAKALLFLIIAGFPVMSYSQEKDAASGLVVDDGFQFVRGHCGTCHSLRLVTQNRADRDGWLQMIRWMQETQGLWSLGTDESVILDYLAKNYGPVSSGRRKPLPPME